MATATPRGLDRWLFAFHASRMYLSFVGQPRLGSSTQTAVESIVLGISRALRAVPPADSVSAHERWNAARKSRPPHRGIVRHSLFMPRPTRSGEFRRLDFFRDVPLLQYERERERCWIRGYFRSSGIIVEVTETIDKNEKREIEVRSISRNGRLINFN